MGKPSKQANNVYIAPKSTNESTAHFSPEHARGSRKWREKGNNGQGPVSICVVLSPTFVKTALMGAEVPFSSDQMSWWHSIAITPSGAPNKDGLGTEICDFRPTCLANDTNRKERHGSEFMVKSWTVASLADCIPVQWTRSHRDSRLLRCSCCA